MICLDGRRPNPSWHFVKGFARGSRPRQNFLTSCVTISLLLFHFDLMNHWLSENNTRYFRSAQRIKCGIRSVGPQSDSVAFCNYILIKIICLASLNVRGPSCRWARSQYLRAQLLKLNWVYFFGRTHLVIRFLMSWLLWLCEGSWSADFRSRALSCVLARDNNKQTEQ